MGTISGSNGTASDNSLRLTCAPYKSLSKYNHQNSASCELGWKMVTQIVIKTNANNSDGLAAEQDKKHWLTVSVFQVHDENDGTPDQQRSCSTGELNHQDITDFDKGQETSFHAAWMFGPCATTRFELEKLAILKIKTPGPWKKWRWDYITVFFSDGSWSTFLYEYVRQETEEIQSVWHGTYRSLPLVPKNASSTARGSLDRVIVKTGNDKWLTRNVDIGVELTGLIWPIGKARRYCSTGILTILEDQFASRRAYVFGREWDGLGSCSAKEFELVYISKIKLRVVNNKQLKPNGIFIDGVILQFSNKLEQTCRVNTTLDENQLTYECKQGVERVLTEIQVTTMDEEWARMRKGRVELSIWHSVVIGGNRVEQELCNTDLLRATEKPFYPGKTDTFNSDYFGRCRDLNLQGNYPTKYGLIHWGDDVWGVLDMTLKFSDDTSIDCFFNKVLENEQEVWCDSDGFEVQK